MSGMRVSAGKVVYFTYSFSDVHGNLIEQIDMPVNYVHGGASGLIPGLERAFEGLEKGSRVDVTLPPEEVFGLPDPTMQIVEALDNVPPEVRRLGAEVMFRNDAGDTKIFRVTRIADGMVMLDGNHPMAGQQALCHAEIVDIRDATSGEQASGTPEDASQWGRM